jgi:protein involved in sex pheromone biosynthesis
MTRKIGFALAALVVGLSACVKDEGDAKRDLTQREKDSILGASQIPGARAVKKTLTSADSAAARQARLDSAERER